MSTPERPLRGSDGATTVEDEWPVVEEEFAQPPPPPPPPRRGPLLWPWLLILLLLVLGGLGADWFFTRDNGGSGASTVDVPLVVHLQRQEAVGRLNRRGLIARVTRRITAASAARPGVVVEQDPRPGANVTRGSVVTLTVSARRSTAVPNIVGRRAVTVPDAVGQSRDSALAALRMAGLVPRAVTVSSSQPQGTVVAQDPHAGERARPGSSVQLNLSNGSAGAGAVPPPAPPPPPPPPATEAVTVPEVTGQAQASAQRQLNASGLRSTLVYVPSTQPLGRVVVQLPPAGASEKRNARIQIRASLGPSSVERRVVPKLAGLDRATATSRLEDAGFKVQTLRQTVSRQAQVGKAVDEQPVGGMRAPVGSMVTIYLGRLA